MADLPGGCIDGAASGAGRHGLIGRVFRFLGMGGGSGSVDDDPGGLEPDFVTDPGQIAGILNFLRKRREPVTVSFPGKPGGARYSTIIIGVPGGEHIECDSLFPERGDRMMIPGEGVRLEARCNGIRLWFDTRCIGLAPDDDGFVHRLGIPCGIHYLQRRGARRVRVPVSDRIGIRLADGGSVYDGVVSDLSETGCFARFDVPMPVEVVRGYRFDDCRIDLPAGGGILRPGFEVRGTDVLDGGSGWGVRGMFFGLDESERDLVRGYVARIERRELRDRSGVLSVSGVWVP